MRLRLRAAAFLALVFAGITCSESATGPKSSVELSPARVFMAAQFSAEAQRAYGVLTAVGTEITEIHIVLTGPDGSTRDTVIAFPPGQDVANIQIDVPPGSDGQPFTALIELRSSDHTVLFSGTQVVFARSSRFPPSSPATVIINYTGPGRTTRTVTVSPRDTTVAGTPALVYTATAVDSGGAPVSNLLVGWTSSDATVATATSTGNATASVLALGKRGASTISARTPLGVTGSSVLTVVPPAARLVVISGGGQTAIAGSQLPLPFIVEAQAADNLPVPGTSITFRSVTAGGSVAQATPRIADAAGRASMILTLGTVAGTYQFEAAAPSITPVTVNQTATPGTPAGIALFSGNLQSDVAGRVLPLPLIVRVTDQFGSPVGGATVTWARTSGGGAVSASSTTTASDGTASITYTLGPTSGPEVITATLQGGGSVQFGATATAVSAGSIAVVSGGGQTGTPNSVLAAPLVVRVADAGGLPLAGQVVVFTSSLNGATFNPASISTNALGLATTAVTLGATPGPVTLTATSGVLFTSTGATIAVGPAASITKVAGDLQTATVSTAVGIAPSVVVKDAGGNAVPNAPVVFAVASGGGTATGLTTTTNTLGVATVGSWTLGATVGANTLTATSGALLTTFSATAVAGTGSVLALTTPPPTTATSGAPLGTQPVVQLRDAAGNNVATAGVVVTASILSGSGSLTNATATTATNGAATFSGLTISGPVGALTLQFSAATYSPVSFGPITLGAGAASVIALSAGTNQTATVSNAVAVPPAVLVTDASGNPVAGASVTFGVITAGAQISNGVTTGTTLTVTTNGSGIAALASWTLGSTVQAYVLNATATGLTGSPVVFTATAVAGTGSQMVFVTPPPVSAASDVALTQQPVVQLKDASGNNVPTAGVVITAGIASGPGTLINVTATTTTGGSATFSGLTISGLAGSYTLSFSSPGVASLTSAPIALVAGPANSMTIIAGNNQASAAGVPVPVAPAVLVRDGGLNPVAGVVVTFDVGTSGSQIANATTSGTTLTVTTNALGIAALTSWTLGAIPRQYALSASAAVPFGSPLTFIASATAGPASQLALTVQPPSTASIGVALVPQPVIQLRDAFGNNVATAGVVVNALISAGGTLVNASATTTSTGTATFSGLGFTGATGNFTLQFGASGFVNNVFGTIAVGAGAPSTIALSAGNNQTATAGTAVPVAPSVLVTDASGNPVAGTVVTFTAVTAGSSVSNVSTTGASVTVPTSALGIATLTAWTLGAQAGPYAMNASAAGLSGSPVAFSATAVSGTGSVLAFVTLPPTTAASGVALSPQPSVQLKDASGNNVTTAGVVVSAGVASGPGGLTNVTATTVTGGLATFSGLAISGIAGAYTLSFSSPGFTPLISAGIVLVPGPANAISLSAGNNQSASVGGQVPVAPAVLVTDNAGNPVVGVVVTFNAVTAGSQIANASTTGTTLTVATNGSGIAALASWTLGTVPQTNTLTASAPVSNGSPVTFTATATAGPGSQLAFTVQPPSVATSGVVFTPAPVVQLRDAFGNNVTTGGVIVSAQITGGTGSLAGSTATTNALGSATFNALAISGIPGSFSLQFSAPGFSPLPFSPIVVGAGAASVIALSAGNNQTAAAGTAVSVGPAVFVTDATGNPVSGVTVTFAVVTAGATVSNGTTTGSSVTVATNGSGVATLTAWTLGAVAQPYSMTASAAGLTGSPIAFSATAVAGPGTQLAFTQQASATTSSGVALAVQPIVQLKDALGNDVLTAGVTVTATITSGTGTLANASAVTNALGSAAFSGLAITGAAGSFTLQFSATGYANLLSAPITVAPGAGVALAFAPAWAPGPTPALSFFSPAPTVQVVDANGNAVALGSVAVQVTIASGPSTPTPFLVNFTASTNASGVASFPGLSVGGAAGTYTLTFTGAGLTPVTSGNVVITAGSGSTLAVVSGNGQTAPVLTAVPVAPSALLTDQFGNPAANQTVTFTVLNAGSVLSNGSTTSSTSVTVQTNGSGVAALTSWTLGSVARVYSISAAFPGAITVFFSATAVAGPAASIAVNAGDNQSGPAGFTLPIPPSVVVRDASGNGVGGVVVQFTVVTAGATVSNGAVTSNTAPVTTNPSSGIAQLNAWTLGPVAQTYTMTATLAGVTGSPITFTAIGTASAASNIIVNAGNNQSATVSTAVAIAPSVLVRDPNGNPVSGTVVTFNVVTAGAQIANASTTGTTLTVATGANGIAALTSWTLGPLAQQYSLTADAPGLVGTPVTFTATAVAGPAAIMVLQAGNGQSTTVGSAVSIPPAVRVLDASSNGVPGTVVTFSVVTPGGQVQNSSTTSSTSVTVVTGPTGIAALSAYFVGTTAQNYTLTAAVSGLPGSPVTFTETAVAGPATHLSYLTLPSSSAQSGVPLTTQPVIQLRDGPGNAVPTAGVTIVATITSGTGSLSNATAVTNASGTATFSGLAISGVAGPFTLAFNDQGGTLTGLTANVTVAAGPASQFSIVVAGSNSVTVNTAFPTAPQVRLRDAQNNNVLQSGVTITATVTTGSGTASTNTASTNVNGIATFTGIRITGTVGLYILTYSATGVTSLPSGPITLNAGAPVAIVASAGTGQTATGGESVPVAPAFRVVDAGNNGIAGMTVFFNTVPTNSQITNASTCCNNLTVVTNANGVATLVSWTLSSTPATNALTGSVPSLPSLGSATITAGGVASNGLSLSFINRPGTPLTSGALLSPQPTFQIRNAQGAPAAIANVPVTAFVVVGSSATAVISGTTTVLTNASGIATFTNLVVTGPSGSLSLRFSSPGYAGTLMGVSIP